MAITTYSELKTAAARWLNRTDLTDRIPEFITLAEKRLNRVLYLRLAEQDENNTLAAGERDVDLPLNFAETVTLWLRETVNSPRFQIPFVPPAHLAITTTAGRPQFWTIDQSSITFDRPADTSYQAILRYKIKYALSDAAPTNDLLTTAPDVYLFATLCEGAAYLLDAEMSAVYEGKLSRAIEELNRTEKRNKAFDTLRVTGMLPPNSSQLSYEDWANG